MEKNNEPDFKYKVIGFFITIGLIVLLVIWLSSGENNTNKKPNDVELMTYAQTVLKDNLSNPKYSSYKDDYTFVDTGLRYKIEGKVNGEKFWMIIEFTNDTYKEYDLISLQVGNDIIYKK